MMSTGMLRPLSVLLVFLLTGPTGFAQASGVQSPTAGPRAPGTPLKISILEGNNAVNSIELLRSVPAVVEIRDANDFPVEGATVTFTLPSTRPGGAFAPDGNPAFVTRSDARGQAITPFISPAGIGTFQIAVTAELGDQKGQGLIEQTNAVGTYMGPPVALKPRYRTKSIWVLAAGAVAGAIVGAVVTGGSSTSAARPAVIITPGTPIFH